MCCVVLFCVVLSADAAAAADAAADATSVATACDETAVMAGKNALSNDEDKSSTIPKHCNVM